MTTAEAIEAMVMRSMRAAGAWPSAVDVARAAADAAPEFDRLVAAGDEPTIKVDRRRGQLVIEIGRAER